jgi:hypothetical protein
MTMDCSNIIELPAFSRQYLILIDLSTQMYIIVGILHGKKRNYMEQINGALML